MKKIPPSQWIWYGSAGHFICGQWCRFHLLTTIGDYAISTVGEFIHPRNSGASEASEALWLKENWPGEDIGLDRKYETMVFKWAGFCEKQGCHCGMPLINPDNLDMGGYNERGAAQRGHYAMCEKWASGEIADDS